MKAGPPLLLRTAALLVGLAGLGLLAWFFDRLVLNPWDRLLDELPFWIPFLITVEGGLLALGYVFLRAARRVDAGEDLFDGRYRRQRPGAR